MWVGPTPFGGLASRGREPRGGVRKLFGMGSTGGGPPRARAPRARRGGERVIEIDVNATGFLNSLRRLRSEFPQVGARALTRTAFEIRDAQRAEIGGGLFNLTGRG